MGDQLVAAASYTTQKKHKRLQPCPQWDSNPRSQNQSASDLHLRPHGHRDRLRCNQTKAREVVEACTTCVAFVNFGLRFAAAAYLEITLGEWIGDAEAF